MVLPRIPVIPFETGGGQAHNSLRFAHLVDLLKFDELLLGSAENAVG